VSDPTAELAVYIAAAAQQVDGAQLVDSKAFMSKVAQLAPDTPGFVDRVSDAVRETVAASRPQAPAAQSTPAPAAPVETAVPVNSVNARLLQQATRRAALGPDYAGEITVQDVQDAPAWVVAEWAQAGRLAGLGIAQQKKRGRR
jgi:hypothetical protein